MKFLSWANNLNQIQETMYLIKRHIKPYEPPTRTQCTIRGEDPAGFDGNRLNQSYHEIRFKNSACVKLIREKESTWEAIRVWCLTWLGLDRMPYCVMFNSSLSELSVAILGDMFYDSVSPLHSCSTCITDRIYCWKKWKWGIIILDKLKYGMLYWINIT